MLFDREYRFVGSLGHNDHNATWCNRAQKKMTTTQEGIVDHR